MTCNKFSETPICLFIHEDCIFQVNEILDSSVINKSFKNICISCLFIHNFSILCEI